MINFARPGLLLWLLLGLFCLRVLGQVLVVRLQPRWLPSMSQWQSGLLPYRVLLSIQVVFLIVMGAMALQVVQGQGVLATSRPVLGRGIVWLSYVYAASMVVRYVVRMARRPDQRWLGGTIPIIFHCVLAAFLFVYGVHISR